MRKISIKVFPLSGTHSEQVEKHYVARMENKLAQAAISAFLDRYDFLVQWSGVFGLRSNQPIIGHLFKHVC
jgi:hypothetical protein